eukprot:ctg_2582.g449
MTSLALQRRQCPSPTRKEHPVQRRRRPLGAEVRCGSGRRGRLRRRGRLLDNVIGGGGGRDGHREHLVGAGGLYAASALLQCPQHAAQLQQLGKSAALHDAAVVQHVDAVGRGEHVGVQRGDDARLAGQHPQQAALVDVAGQRRTHLAERLVKQIQLRRGVQGAGHAQSLRLLGGELGAGLVQHRLAAVAHRVEVGTQRDGIDGALEAHCVEARAETDVGPHGGAQDERHLQRARYRRRPPQQAGGLFHFAQDGVQQRGAAGTGRAGQHHQFASARDQIDIVQGKGRRGGGMRRGGYFGGAGRLAPERCLAGDVGGPRGRYHIGIPTPLFHESPTSARPALRRRLDVAQQLGRQPCALRADVGGGAGGRLVRLLLLTVMVTTGQGIRSCRPAADEQRRFRRRQLCLVQGVGLRVRPGEVPRADRQHRRCVPLGGRPAAPLMLVIALVLPQRRQQQERGNAGTGAPQVDYGRIHHGQHQQRHTQYEKVGEGGEHPGWRQLAVARRVHQKSGAAGGARAADEQPRAQHVEEGGFVQVMQLLLAHVVDALAERLLPRKLLHSAHALQQLVGEAHPLV